jgi:hypothetical protein
MSTLNESIDRAIGAMQKLKEATYDSTEKDRQMMEEFYRLQLEDSEHRRCIANIGGSECVN